MTNLINDFLNLSLQYKATLIFILIEIVFFVTVFFSNRYIHNRLKKRNKNKQIQNNHNNKSLKVKVVLKNNEIQFLNHLEEKNTIVVQSKTINHSDVSNEDIIKNVFVTK